jgi:hypothetical protein
MSVGGFHEEHRRKPLRQDDAGPVVREWRRKERANQLAKVRMLRIAAERSLEARIDAEADALVQEQEARREMREHARQLAREIEWEAQDRAAGLGYNPYIQPGDAGYISPTEARVRRAVGDRLMASAVGPLGRGGC